MQGSTVLVTGSTDGIGWHTANNLARAGATVLVHGRNMQKAQSAAERIKAAAGKSVNVQHFAADLANQTEVRKLAMDIKNVCAKLDVLVNNAGVFAERLERSIEGYELTWAVNVIAPYLLTGLLLDVTSERVVNERGFSSHGTYSLSKLASQMFTAELAARLKAAAPVVNCLDPGTVNTKMLYAGWGPCGIPLSSANNLTELVTGYDYGKATGKYYVGLRSRRMNAPANDATARQRLWSVLEEQTDFHYRFA